MMTTRRFLWFFLALTLAAAACSAPIETQTPPPPAPVIQTVIPTEASPTPLPPTPTSAPALSLETFKNAEIHAPQYDKTVKLVNGKYEGGSGADYLLVQLLDQSAVGDLNGDDLPDTALLLAENGGGSGVFVSVVIFLNQGRQPVQAGAVLIDDRAKVNRLTIQNGAVVVDALIHGVNDPMSDPTFAVSESYQIVGDGLQLARFTSRTPDNKERVIIIDAPAEGSEVSGSFTVKGSVSIAPFENNLAYAVFPEGAPEPIIHSGLLVQADTPGGPGTFALPLDFTTAGISGPVRIQISDTSAADGSFLAVATLHLVLK
jgi:hypothetical protein